MRLTVARMLSIFTLFCMSLAPAADPTRWSSELSVRQFKIHSDFELQATETLVAELDRMSHSIEQLLGPFVERQEVHIVLFETQAEYARYMQNYFPTLPQRRALYIQDRGPGMLFTHWHKDVATDLRHEVTHALLNQGAHHLPLWLDEGLAEYFEVEASHRFSGCQYLSEVSERAAKGIVPSLKRLEEIGSLEAFADAHYRDSWSWVHFLLHRNAQTRKLLLEYIQGATSGAEQLALSRQLSELTIDVSVEYQLHFAAIATVEK